MGTNASGDDLGSSGTPTPDQQKKDEADLKKLRSLLQSPVDAKVVQVAQRFDEPALRAEAVGEILPSAIRRFHSEGRGPLADALMPSVESALQRSVKKDPQTIIDVVFPVIGPAIRKAIRQAISGLVSSINQNVEYTFTPRGLRWRIEAWRKKKSLGEIILSKSLIWRVEQALLVHGETGLLLAHVTQPDIVGKDQGDVVSGMLTALQDFMRDSFGMKSTEGLDSFRAGDRQVVVERGTQAVLAAVVYGDPPVDLSLELQETLELVHRDALQELAHFSGDAEPFERFESPLEDLLIEEKREVKKNPLVTWLLIVAATGLTLWGIISLVNSHMTKRRFEEYLDAVKQEPGWVVVDSERRDGQFHLVGLRDPDSADPEALIESFQLRKEDVESRWVPYLSEAKACVLQRSNRLLDPPEGVTLELSDGVLTARGQASALWLNQAERLSPAIVGVKRFDVSAVHDPALADLQAGFERSDSLDPIFEPGSPEWGVASESNLKLQGQLFRAVAQRTYLLGYRTTLSLWAELPPSAGPVAQSLAEERIRRVARVFKNYAPLGMTVVVEVVREKAGGDANDPRVDWSAVLERVKTPR